MFVDWFRRVALKLNVRSCEGIGLVLEKRPAGRGCAYSAGRQHFDRTALGSMAAKKDLARKDGMLHQFGGVQGSIMKLGGQEWRAAAPRLRQLVGKPWESPASEKSVGIGNKDLWRIQYGKTKTDGGDIKYKVE